MKYYCTESELICFNTDTEELEHYVKDKPEEI